MANLIDRLSEVLAPGRPLDEAARELCTLLRREVPHYPWVGVYMIEGGDTLVLRAWDGPQATQHVRIPVGQGICGLAAREARTVIVADVSKDPRYLQCFLNTKSEIVVPVFREGEVVGEIDIDGNAIGAFNEADRILLEWVADRLGRLSR
jgi:GAF domain-containing protein